MRGKQRRSRLRKGSPIMKKLIASSCAHFCVDLCCAALFFGYLNASPQWWLCMVLYNTCAFALQLPLGLIADARNRNLPFAAFGCALICISFFLKGISVVAALISGLGNGMFHVGAGLEVMNSSKKAAPLGVFVSPGAIGLYLGTALASFISSNGWLLPLIMILTGLCLLCVGLRDGSFVSDNQRLSLSVPKSTLFPLVCLFFVVVLRSLLSGAFSTGPHDIPGIIPVLCLALGKAAGGFAGDGLGFRNAAVLSLGGAALLLLLPRGYVTLLSLFLFNMTMPLTLHEAAKLLPGTKGAVFGLLTLALFVGMIPRFISISLSLSPLAWTALVFLSLGLLLVGLREEVRHA